ncbi:hypothetical protein F5883DRAFT_560052 [Diaporthe sp. PMI_573]|nr:hypothetical protein F5883DRAFT_560052 [Diaporthaceae sp. PMI_573]
MLSLRVCRYLWLRRRLGMRASGRGGWPVVVGSVAVPVAACQFALGAAFPGVALPAMGSSLLSFLWLFDVLWGMKCEDDILRPDRV